MFTKICKGVLWLCIIGGCVLSISIGSINSDFAWVIPVGILLSFVMASGLGMIIEISENIKACREHLSTITYKSGSFSGRSPAPEAIFKEPEETLSKPTAELYRQPQSIDEAQYCTQCGAKLTDGMNFCTQCGKKR